jgi:hypothetical protein
MPISGIKCVDFILSAVGEGVVNHNGSYTVYNPAAEATVKNHMFPKLRGIDPMQRIAKNGENGKSMSISLSDEAFSKAKLIVSAECIRSQLFRDVSFGLYKVSVSNVSDVLASLHGLVRGYLITEGGRNFARKSSLYVTDFECAKPELSFNQGTNSKARGTVDEKTSIYSYFKTGRDLAYTAKASLSVEDLQFIPLENSLGRSAFDFQVTVQTGVELAAKITRFLTDIAEENQAPEAKFVKKAVRCGAVSQVGDAGILLNDDAIRVIASQVEQLLQNLYIRQGKGYLQVTSVLVDYNTGGRVFRAEADPGIANAQPTTEFAKYYTAHDMTDVEFATLQEDNKKKAAEINAAKKLAKSAPKKAAAPADTQAA